MFPVRLLIVAVPERISRKAAEEIPHVLRHLQVPVETSAGMEQRGQRSSLLNSLFCQKIQVLCGLSRILSEPQSPAEQMPGIHDRRREFLIRVSGMQAYRPHIGVVTVGDGPDGGVSVGIGQSYLGCSVAAHRYSRDESVLAPCRDTVVAVYDPGQFFREVPEERFSVHHVGITRQLRGRHHHSDLSVRAVTLDAGVSEPVTAVMAGPVKQIKYRISFFRGKRLCRCQFALVGERHPDRLVH